MAASTVYSWTTEDGTAAYTNDAKRIPAKYKASAKRRTLGTLKNYPRLSKSDVKFETPYEQRVLARLKKLRGGPPAVSAAGAVAGHPITIDVGMGSGEGDRDQVSIPVDLLGEGPIVTEEFTVRMRDSIASRKVQITRRGDEILAVRVAAKNQRKINERLDAAAANALGGRKVPTIGPN
jgi:hypothetical protein